MNASPPASTAQPPASIAPRRAALAGAIGSTIEWYDFFLYGTASALVFGDVFFPTGDPFVSRLLAFASFGVAFLARPLGGILFGHLGDKYGRKPVLVATLLIMGLSTGLVGALPSYEAIGITAPIILVSLRILQGISVGGEYGGAVLMAVEHADEKNKSFYGSWVQAGSPAGLILCNTVFLVAAVGFSGSEWAWRIPFFISFLLVAVGLYIRTRIAESPEFRAAQEQQEVKRNPLAGVLRIAKLRTVLVSLAYVGAGVTVYIVAVFSLSFGTVELNYSMEQMLMLVVVGQAAAFVAMLIFGKTWRSGSLPQGIHRRLRAHGPHVRAVDARNASRKPGVGSHRIRPHQYPVCRCVRVDGSVLCHHVRDDDRIHRSFYRIPVRHGHQQRHRADHRTELVGGHQLGMVHRGVHAHFLSRLCWCGDCASAPESEERCACAPPGSGGRRRVETGG